SVRLRGSTSITGSSEPLFIVDGVILGADQVDLGALDIESIEVVKGAALPCHRVVNRLGALTGRMHFGSPHIMEDLLRNEGITFTEDGRVDLEKHLWDPAAAVEAS
ncbi:MAG: hypothetical protein D6746_02660, partial [Bacteroidetes bacterium]